ncbi:hypothetical protein GYMLUDRAFT_265194 [Collybiopsis luxurians FD-317 M1]|uniref:MYND-type domain-containing protein n=1 Tax=Collybiopsis luxurians FD-317 M1 TaxID=944289 RepID=A0A0D0CDL7_9AGAR|nr:hypothetical protein GYMLUDRAFT_265194 [Collybiopsis luxurians FD-317 M1]
MQQYVNSFLRAIGKNLVYHQALGQFRKSVVGIDGKEIPSSLKKTWYDVQKQGKQLDNYYRVIKAHLPPMCSRKDQCLRQAFSGKPFRICSQCRVESYCSIGCQKADWPAHSINCEKTKQRLEQGAHADPSDFDLTCLKLITQTVIEEHLAELMNMWVHAISTYNDNDPLSNPLMILDFCDFPVSYSIKSMEEGRMLVDGEFFFITQLERNDIGIDPVTMEVFQFKYLAIFPQCGKFHYIYSTHFTGPSTIRFFWEEWES